jgi:hypothetical protein
MADRATYILMGTYILLFGGLFVCVFGAIVFLVREQEAIERPVAAPVDRRRSALRSEARGDAVASGTPAVVAPPTQLMPS